MLGLRDSVTMQSKLNDAHNAHGLVCLSLIKALRDIIRTINTDNSLSLSLLPSFSLSFLRADSQLIDSELEFAAATVQYGCGFCLNFYDVHSVLHLNS